MKERPRPYGTLKYCQVLWELICSDTSTKSCGFIKPEQAFPLKEEQPSRRRRDAPYRVCCALKPFFIFKEIELKSGCTDSVENLRLNGAT